MSQQFRLNAILISQQCALKTLIFHQTDARNFISVFFSFQICNILTSKTAKQKQTIIIYTIKSVQSFLLMHFENK